MLIHDIEDFLIILPPNSPDLRSQLLNAFLLFCRLPPTATSTDIFNRYIDSFIDGHILQRTNTWVTKQYFTNKNEEAETTRILDALNPPFPNHQVSPETMFGSSLWFQYLEGW